jgi:hypothetical protein
MKKLITIVALTATVISAPALAKSARNAADHAPVAYQQPSDIVTYGGQVVGQDPDANVRLSILRDAETGFGE